MATITQVQVQIGGAPPPSESLVPRFRLRADALIGILEAHRDWRDPLSCKVRRWALEAFRGVEEAPAEIFETRVRGILDTLRQKILIDPLYREPLREAPYLIDGENVLPESRFDDLYHTLCQTRLPCVSPFNQRPLQYRERVHAFAMAVLRWSGVACQEEPRMAAVPLEGIDAAFIKYLTYQTLASASIDLQSGEKEEQRLLRHTAQVEAHTAELQQNHDSAMAAMIDELHTRVQTAERAIRNLEQTHRERMIDLETQIRHAEAEIQVLQERVAETESVRERQQNEIAALQRRVRAAEAELARIRAMMDDDDGICVIA